MYSVLAWVGRACLFFAVFLAVDSYKFDNYTREDMAELATLQRKFMHQPRASVSDVDGGCSCRLDSSEISCGCCTSFHLFSSPYKVCAKAGIDVRQLAILIHFTINGEGPPIRIQPEFCIRLPFPLWLIRICLGVYHADFCIDDNNLSQSTFKICLQADLVILIPVFTVDFNCLVLTKNGIDVDDSIHTDRPGIITYKIGKGVSLNNPFRADDDDDFKVITVGEEQKRISLFGKKKDPDNLVCDQVTDLKKVCKPKKLNFNATWMH